MRKMFLDNLPRRGKTNQIDWKKCIGETVNFVFDDIEGEVKILNIDYGKGKRVTIQYKDEEFNIDSNNFKNCGLSAVLKKNTSSFKIDIGHHFLDNRRDMVILDRKKVKKETVENWNCMRKVYLYRCNICGAELWADESNLLRGSSCGCCCNHVTVPGINTLWETDRWMCDLGVSEEDAKRCAKTSTEKINVICPLCKILKQTTPSHIYNSKSIGCSCNSTNVSYPERVFISLLKQLNIEYIYQLGKGTFEWCDSYRYDFYLPDYNCIIEVNGSQHYTPAWRKSVEEIIENDKLKMNLAKKNGIKEYVVINCSKSEMEFIKDNIYKSKLKKLIDLSSVNWDICDKNATTNLTKEICDYWSQRGENENVTSLGLVFNLGRQTIRKHIKKGASLGWCEYDAKKESVKRIRRKNS